jgi:peptidyl-prolyl cis-trans isomerase C
MSSTRFASHSLLIMIVGLFTFAAYSGVGTAAQPAQGDIVARWGKQIITNNDIDLRISSYPPELQAKLKDPAQRQQYLESLIQIQIAGAEAKALKLDKKKNIAIRIADTTNSILLQEYMSEKLAALKTPTDQEAEAFFDAHKSEYLTPASIRAQHILIEVKPDTKPEDVSAAEAKANKIYEELIAGGDFARLAEKYSDDTESKSRGGDLGSFNPEQMAPEFTKPVSGMKKDELSKPFRTPFGFHIVKVNDLTPPKQMSFKDVREDVVMKLDNSNREKLVYGELERLKKKYKVKVY